MIQLGMEIPTCALEELSPLLDIDFPLAHKVLKDEQYSLFFRKQPAERISILDNSTHEFGKPLPQTELHRAVDLCSPTYLVAPDIVHPQTDEAQHLQNVEWLRQTTQASFNCGVAFVVSGRTKEERQQYLQDAATHGASTICFSFHIPKRLSWFKELSLSDLTPFTRIHLLGVSTLSELERWRRVSEDFPQFNWSIDTSKPLKFGAQLKSLRDVKDLRGGSLRSKEVLELQTLTTDQLECTKHNIRVLKEICA